MKPTLRLKLIQYLKEKRDWVHGGQLERFGQGEGYEGETVKRRLRELGQPDHPAFTPEIDQKIEKGAVMYKWIGSMPEPRITPKMPPNSSCCAKYALIGIHATNCVIFENMERQAKVLEEETQRQLNLI